MKQWKTEELLQNFYAISGVKVALFDSRFHCVAVAGQNEGYCHFLHRSRHCLDTCMQSDIDAFRHVRETGKPYVYKCPFGLFEAIAPVMINEEVRAYLILGPVAEPTKDGDRDLLDCAKRISPEWSEEILRAKLKKMIRLHEKEVYALCDALTVYAAYFENSTQLLSNEKTIGQMVKSYVVHNISKKITLSELSLHAHCSTVTLTEHFRREYGMTIMQYVLKKRMQLAEQLLIDNVLSITDISIKCGFSDVEYFSRCFKDTHGLPPSEWRGKQTDEQKNK
ncbi:MAG: helix-turn-helix domain-containing protein [Ruminococcaceae bacterium]|nr:helix-turn-helix domain-containing protein [Oscillospiraceae bacterium]